MLKRRMLKELLNQVDLLSWGQADLEKRVTALENSLKVPKKTKTSKASKATKAKD